jgi:hypothetical protein
MIRLDQINMPAIIRHYALANTPRYLYKHLRSESSVETLAAESSPDELLAAIEEIEANAGRTASDVGVAYAMLVALSYQPYAKVQEALARWTPQILSWASAIISIIQEPKVAVSDATGVIRANSGHLVSSPISNDIANLIF